MISPELSAEKLLMWCTELWIWICVSLIASAVCSIEMQLSLICWVPWDSNFLTTKEIYLFLMFVFILEILAWICNIWFCMFTQCDLDFRVCFIGRSSKYNVSKKPKYYWFKMPREKFLQLNKHCLWERWRKNSTMIIYWFKSKTVLTLNKVMSLLV